MAIYDISEPDLPVPQQIVVDTSFLLALRLADDNPHVAEVRMFMRRMTGLVAAYNMVIWLPLPVLQECYHIILMNGLRQAWERMPPDSRPANWLKAYKDQPALVQPLLPILTRFRELLAAIPVTPVRSTDLAASDNVEPLEQRLLTFIADYDLLPQDALILAHAERLGVFNVATLDRDWQRATRFNLYTVPSP